MREFDIITQGQRSLTYARGQHASTNGHLIPFFGNMVLPEITAGKVNEYRIRRLEEDTARCFRNQHLEAMSEEKGGFKERPRSSGGLAFGGGSVDRCSVLYDGIVAVITRAW